MREGVQRTRESSADRPNQASPLFLDVCECGGELRLLEVNPFGGADLYACDPFAVVDSLSALALRE